MVIVIDLEIFADSASIDSVSKEVRIQISNIDAETTGSIIEQLVNQVSACDILDCISEENLNTYMQEKYGVTRMVK
jgi:hypothetical protein